MSADGPRSKGKCAYMCVYVCVCVCVCECVCVCVCVIVNLEMARGVKVIHNGGSSPLPSLTTHPKSGAHCHIPQSRKDSRQNAHTHTHTHIHTHTHLLSS